MVVMMAMMMRAMNFMVRQRVVQQSYCAKSAVDAQQVYTTIEVDVEGNEEASAEAEGLQDASTAQTHGRFKYACGPKLHIN